MTIMHFLQNSAKNGVSHKVRIESQTPNQSLVKVGLSLLGLMAFSLPTISVSAYPEVPAVRRADEFIDSIGMRTELWWVNVQTGPLAQNPYKTNYAGVKSKLLALRIRHIREGANCGLSDWPLILSKMTDMKNSGIKSSALFSDLSIPPGYPSSNLGQITTAYQNCFNQVKDVVDQVEGLNEPDGSATATVFGYTFPNSALISQQAL